MPVVLVVFVAVNDVLASNIGTFCSLRFRLLLFRCRFAGIAILQETIVDSFFDLFVGLAAGSHFDVKKHSDVHGCLNGLLDPNVLIVALRILCGLHSGEVILEACDPAVNSIHDLDKFYLCCLLDVVDLLGFIGVLHEEVASELPELINLALVLILQPLKVEFANFGRVHGLTQLHVSLLDLLNFFCGFVLLAAKHLIDSGITDFLELIDSPFSILEGSLGCIQATALQIDGVCLGK